MRRKRNGTCVPPYSPRWIFHSDPRCHRSSGSAQCEPLELSGRCVSSDVKRRSHTTPTTHVKGTSEPLPSDRFLRSQWGRGRSGPVRGETDVCHGFRLSRPRHHPRQSRTSPGPRVLGTSDRRRSPDSLGGCSERSVPREWCPCRHVLLTDDLTFAGLDEPAVFLLSVDVDDSGLCTGDPDFPTQNLH